MKITIATLMLGLMSNSAFAHTKNVFEENNLKHVTEKSPLLIKKFASGVAALSDVKEIKAGCTSFRISKNKMMTNFHCLPLVHKHFQLAATNGVFLGPMSDYLFKFLAFNYKKEPVATQVIDALGFLPEWLPKNNKEMPVYMNLFPKVTGYISFNKTIDFNGDFKNTALKITSVDAVNEDLDYTVFTVSNLTKDQQIFELSHNDVIDNTKLAMIGHPASKGMDGMKVFEASHHCEVVDAKLGQIFNRKHNFGHHCDTEGGSSGSPVFNRQTGKVVGLHWAGLGKENMNKAVKMKFILKDIKQNHPKLYEVIK